MTEKLIKTSMAFCDVHQHDQSRKVKLKTWATLRYKNMSEEERLKVQKEMENN